ncbi:MAG: prepilin-type N-terminal cleavage/methylation domain-containing protein [Nannocystaceae bacterium]|nr:prepilin-type N-terminal cleavage/methylation domain-containing protein [Nannocystaceae bacterium]
MAGPRHAALIRRRQAGFTLIELMVAMIVSGIVILGIFAFSTIQQSTAGLHERNVRVQQALEGAMWSIAQDVRAAGLGFARSCTGLRIYDPATGTLINPGGGAGPIGARRDAATDEPYWVLRDGIQAHWDSSDGGSLAGNNDSSATPDSVADSFDVIVAEPAYLNSMGLFILETSLDAGDTVVTVRTSNLLDNTDGASLAQVQQMFPPGSFIAVGRVAATATNPFLPEAQGQCLLLQITGDVAADASDPQLWSLPIDPGLSDFNAGLGVLLSDNNGSPVCPLGAGCDDWDPTPGGLDNVARSSGIMPLGRLRWSRYEIDYTVPTMPYLVRYDIIGHQAAVDPTSLGAIEYPHCTVGNCPGAGLHLPGSGSPPTAVAVGPMIEDMQIAVGCDGYTIAGAASPINEIPPPDPGFEEVGPVAGLGGPNLSVDENPSGNLRGRDEWVGNAIEELWAPDCVYYGTAEYDAVAWAALEGNAPPPAFRMSPQTLRITLVGSSEFTEEAGGLSTDQVLAVEDRVVVTSEVGPRQRFTVTENFTPKNLRWRDTTAP